jgi:hypothetical protein
MDWFIGLEPNIPNLPGKDLLVHQLSDCIPNLPIIVHIFGLNIPTYSIAAFFILSID